MKSWMSSGIALVFFLLFLGFLNGSLQGLLESQRKMQEDLQQMVMLTQAFAQETSRLAQVPQKIEKIEKASQNMAKVIAHTNASLDSAILLQQKGLAGLKKLDREIVTLNRNLSPLPGYFRDIRGNLKKTEETTAQTKNFLKRLHSYLITATRALAEINKSIP